MEDRAAHRKLHKLFFLVFLLTVVTVVMSACLPIVAQNEEGTAPGAADVWLHDMDALDQFLRQYHPDPFFRTGDGSWLEGLSAARDLVEIGGCDAAITT